MNVLSDGLSIIGACLGSARTCFDSEGALRHHADQLAAMAADDERYNWRIRDFARELAAVADQLAESARCFRERDVQGSIAAVNAAAARWETADKSFERHYSAGG